VRFRGRIRPAAGTELFTLGDGLGRARRIRRVGFGPIDGSAPAWILFRVRRGDPTPGAYRFLRRERPGRVRIFLFLAPSVGPGTARAFLSTIGPPDGFYRAYFAERPDLEPSELTLSLAGGRARSKAERSGDFSDRARGARHGLWRRLGSRPSSEPLHEVGPLCG
jgi:hypothetical protein